MLSLIYQLETQRLDYALHYFYRGAAPLLKQVKQVKQAMRGGTLHLYPGDGLGQVKKRLVDIVPPWQADYCLYCCGPEPMMTAFDALAATWQPHQLQQEHFAGLTVDDAMFPPYTLELRRSGKTIAVRGGQTPLQALLEADVDIDHSCEGGICGACSVPWCDGKPVHRDKVLTPEERQRRVILCVAGCNSEKLVLDL